MDKTGDNFQQETKYDRDNLAGSKRGAFSNPSLYKVYQDCPKIELPSFEQKRKASLHQALLMRKSIRKYSLSALKLKDLSYLLWASTGIQRTEMGYQFRTSPSAGALYPIETYLAANNVDALKNGLYHYSIKQHHLEQLQTGELGKQLSPAALHQPMCLAAPVVFLWTAVFERCKVKYGQRAYRYIYLEAGHIAENLALAAVALNLGTCQIGAFFDEEINHILGIDGENESILYLSTVGFTG